MRHDERKQDDGHACSDEGFQLGRMDGHDEHRYDHGCATEHSSNQARFQSVFSLESIQPLASLEVSFSDSSSFLGRFSIGQGTLDYDKGFVPAVFQTSTGVSL